MPKKDKRSYTEAFPEQELDQQGEVTKVVLYACIKHVSHLTAES